MDHRIYRPEDLSRLGVNIVGVVPRFDKIIRTEFARKETVEVDGLMINTALISLLNPISPITECYRGIHTNLQFSLPDKVLKTMLVTSAMPEEGKTVTSTNLAVTVARSGRRTLYVDADLRRPRGHTMLGLSRKPGLSDVLLGKNLLDPKALENGDRWALCPACRSTGAQPSRTPRLEADAFTDRAVETALRCYHLRYRSDVACYRRDAALDPV